MESQETTIEEKKCLMITKNGRNPIAKASHFIKPILQNNAKTPHKPSTNIPFTPALPNVCFNGWKAPNEKWVKWVDTLYPTYHMIWKRVGIYDAILSTRYRIKRNDELFFSLAERWNLETNTFVFCWGECGLTLEDVVVLGGYSVLGDSVSKGDKDQNFMVVKEKLELVYGKVSSQCGWMKYFMGGESEVEHEAFLTLWLSKYVFPASSLNGIIKRFISMAIHLARGTKIALAPVVLANIYSDLNLLKTAMSGDVDRDDLVVLTLWSPLYLVQVWAWERFPEFSPNPKSVGVGEPRLSRWSNLNRVQMGNVRPMLQSAGDSFVWRPYCKDVENSGLPLFYRENDARVVVSDGLDDGLRSWVRIIRCCELSGVGSIEQYNPHRVAMQLGYDQDIPVGVDRWMVEPGIPREVQWTYAWKSFVQPINDHVLYVPSRTYEPMVSVRYFKWNREGVLASRAHFDGVPRKKRSVKKIRRIQDIKKRKRFAHEKVVSSPKSVLVSSKEVGIHCDVPPGFKPKSGFADHANTPQKNVGNEADAPPGFVPKNIPRHHFEVNVNVNVGSDCEVPPGFSQKPASKIKEERVDPFLICSCQKSYASAASIVPRGETKSGTQEQGKSMKIEPVILKEVKSDLGQWFQTSNGMTQKTIAHGTDARNAVDVTDRIQGLERLVKEVKTAN